jgi:hypothetical protein
VFFFLFFVFKFRRLKNGKKLQFTRGCLKKTKSRKFNKFLFLPFWFVCCVCVFYVGVCWGGRGGRTKFRSFFFPTVFVSRQSNALCPAGSSEPLTIYLSLLYATHRHTISCYNEYYTRSSVCCAARSAGEASKLRP